jgi:hypothetical protein
MPANSSFTSSKMSASFIGNAIFLRRSSNSTTKESSHKLNTNGDQTLQQFLPSQIRAEGRSDERERNAKEPEPEDALALGFASPNQF